MFVDRAKIFIKSGKGGDGAVSFGACNERPHGAWTARGCGKRRKGRQRER